MDFILRLWISIFFVCESFSFNQNLEFLQNYEIIDINTNLHTRDGVDPLRRKTPISVEFEAFGRHFRIFLQVDHSISSSTKIFIHDDNTEELDMLNIPQAFIYTGIVEEETYSSVCGYFDGNVFVGRVQSVKEVYYVETAFFYLKKEQYKDKALIYRERDVTFINKNIIYESLFNEYTRFYNNSNDDLIDYDVVRQEALQERGMPKKSDKLICELELIADHTFAKLMNGSRTKAVAEMLYHAKIADEIFKRIDLNRDHIPEGLGFRVTKITVFKNKKSPKYFLKERFYSATFYLQKISRSYRNRWCMVAVFCNRDFHVLGISYSDGYCRGLQRFSAVNIAVVNILNIRGQTIYSRLQASYTLTHEIGHAFGSDDDPFNHSVCSPGDLNRTQRNYIMYPYGATESTFHLFNWKFSLCSLYNFRRNTASGGRCLKGKSKPRCGNRMKEIGEECDCGREKICKIIDPCCNPKGSPNECKLKNKSREFCSFRESDCCTEECEILPKSKNRICFVYKHCRQVIATCDGVSPQCPEIVSPDGTPCIKPTHFCYFGQCMRNICKEKNLNPCKCPPSKECHVCCMNANGTCQSSQDLDLLQRYTQSYFVIPGTPCNDSTGICTRNGICSSNLEGVFTSSGGAILVDALQISFASISVIFIVLGIVLYYFKKIKKFKKPEHSMQK
ncbi:disintegrin and metalloproteinase domain-containing protein 10-like [Centruroides sculpturatus]|uniref:disintegrin and metalloproteinase domain-containing protein 10-like n=1 Tax=Centruroides sculpturatus TaxID=218467 RepID=UPI000C6D7BD6|nr:disintegrin and metalloproteinase domain-containing protein 10-like [Centruroides sculpturatus]